MVAWGMPILPKSDRSWDSLPKSVSEMLPDIPEIAADAGNAPVFSIAQGKYAAKAAEIFQLGSQVALGGLLVNVGMPMKDAFDLMLEAIDVDVKSEVASKLAEGGRNLMEAWKALRDQGESGQELAEVTTETAVGTGVSAVSIIPVAGWIIKIAWNVGKAIHGMIKLARDTDAYASANQMEALFPPTTFNPNLDNIVLNAVLSDLANKKDWSRRFGPPSLGEEHWSHTLPDYRRISLETGGFEIVRVKGRSDGPAGPGTGVELDWSADGWLGMVPGTPYLHQGIQVDASGKTVRDMGDILMPSSREVLVWLWGSVIGHKARATPAMYCVNADVLRTWEGYIHDLHIYIHENLDAPTSTKQAIIDYYNKRGSQKVFNWGSSIKPVENEWDNYWPAKQARDLKDRQMGMLDTLLCAYVNDDAVALKQDSDMRDRWDERRRQLLEHPARCEVDLSSVPDWAYRQELKDRNVGAPACGGGLGFRANPPQPPPDFPAGTTYGNPTKRKPKKKSSLPTAFPFIAGAGAYFAWKSGALKKLIPGM